MIKPIKITVCVLCRKPVFGRHAGLKALWSHIKLFDIEHFKAMRGCWVGTYRTFGCLTCLYNISPLLATLRFWKNMGKELIFPEGFDCKGE